MGMNNIPEDDCNSNTGLNKKLSHKQWKKLKRKLHRQALAKQKESEEKTAVSSESEGQEASEDEKERLRQHELWLERERQAQAAWKAKKEWEEKERRRKEEEERKIREEWEEQQKREAEAEEKRRKEEEEKKKRQDELLQKATENENKDVWHNPLAPVQYSEERKVENCPFFMKTGACRFAERCSRSHPFPDSSVTLLFPGMYTHFGLQESMRDEYDTDISLEYEESETYQHFKEFYEDVLPELKAVGRVVQFKVCCNHEPHLRGNVYVQFASEEEAIRGFAAFNGRWYGGRQLQCEFTVVTKWKGAICGLFHMKRCPKGKNCNFLHVFRNPNGEFRDADRDFEFASSQRHEGRSERGSSKRDDRQFYSERGYRNGRRRSSYRDREDDSYYRRESHSQSYREDDRDGRDQRRRRRSRSKDRSRSRDRRRSRSNDRQSPKQHYHDSRDKGDFKNRYKNRSDRNSGQSPSLHRETPKSHRSRSRSKHHSRHKSRSRSCSSSDRERTDHVQTDIKDTEIENGSSSRSLLPRARTRSLSSEGQRSDSSEHKRKSKRTYSKSRSKSRSRSRSQSRDRKRKHKKKHKKNKKSKKKSRSDMEQSVLITSPDLDKEHREVDLVSESGD
ncbi:U2 small nuclear ribonucleoprotein auxiliary factor 35 kDa subunit-related protein 1 [Lingula anatina]|uniref:U2 small nuclear ribonucleoprotein auxiliary factor 35 kDa subunit-related protein 1 n=1 Tax=Lingula anatina TaxID=7574 RepID=A0A1S3K1G8_LINAN|nr:U2 small nuclear ribonucleoprotein auxiliary factor 35 kDa subunit-related protein 1 [Lingula anatina]|eukprot:XP_013416377.1 U2 small nuclear ribonucleoprotein auxiliary factor 35 kDa subunit-related protein 1 [Lingula anatina]